MKFSVALVRNPNSDIVCDWEVRVGLNFSPSRCVLAVRTQRYVYERVDSSSERSENSGTRSIFVAPNRTREERLERKKLVDLMKATKRDLS